MTVISNTQGCGDMSVSGWVDVISISGQDPKEESKGPQEPEPVGGETSPLGGGVIDDLGDVVSDAADVVNDVIEEAGNIIVDAANEALGTMPKTSLEMAGGAYDVVTGNGGEMVEDVVDKFKESVADDVGTAIGNGVTNALPNGWEVGVEALWRDHAKTKVELNLKYNWTLCEWRNLEVGGEKLAIDVETFVKVGGGYQLGDGLFGDAGVGLGVDLWHQGSGWGFTGGVEHGVNGGTNLFGGIEFSFGR